jgi:hypothetical protein
VELCIDNVSDVSWDDGAFTRLILPQQQKNLLLSIVEGKLKQKEAFDDVINGKGL